MIITTVVIIINIIVIINRITNIIIITLLHDLIKVSLHSFHIALLSEIPITSIFTVSRLVVLQSHFEL